MSVFYHLVRLALKGLKGIACLRWLINGKVALCTRPSSLGETCKIQKGTLEHESGDSWAEGKPDIHQQEVGNGNTLQNFGIRTQRGTLFF